MPDIDGYPTEQELQVVRTWNYKDPASLITYLQSIWWHDGPTYKWGKDVLGHKVVRIEMHTWGWSGNEDIISQLQNGSKDHVPMFWICWWVQSKRGGHYTFEVPKWAWERSSGES